MHKVITCLLFLSLIAAMPIKVLAHVELDYPQGSETFIAGQTVLIQWHIAVPHEQLNWDLHFSADGGFNWEVIQLNIPVTQLSYSWVVPDTFIQTGKIRIFQDNTDQDYLDISGNFTIVPNTMPPILDAPAQDLVIECDPATQMATIQAWLNNHGGAAITHFCDGLVWTHDFLLLEQGCGNTGFEEVTFTGADECGFVITTASLIISDTSPPSITEAAKDLTVECDGGGNTNSLNNWLTTHGGAQANDLCGNISWSHNFTNLSDDCGLTGSATVTFSATDACGNESTTVATFRIVDHDRPVLGHPAQSMTIECNAPGQELALQNWLDNNGDANVVELCGQVTWTNDFTGLSDDCGETGIAIVNFTATDECGNATTTTAQFRIEDHTAPVFQVFPQDTTILCGANKVNDIQKWIANHAGGIANDFCGSIAWSSDFTLPVPDTCDVEKLVTFAITDECLNVNTATAVLALEEPEPVATQDLVIQSISVFPNPADDVLTIDAGQIKLFPLQVSILDPQGRVVMSNKMVEQVKSFSIDQVIPGMYWVRLASGDEVYFAKVVIE